MQKILISLLLAFLFCTAGFSQIRLNLSGDWPDDVEAKLFVFDGIASHLVESNVLSFGGYDFEIAEPEHEGMYILQLGDSLGLIYETRLIYTAETLTFDLKLEDQSLKTIWNSGDENRVYSEFISQRDQMMVRLRSLRNLYGYYPDTESGFYQNLGHEFNQQSHDLDSLFEHYTLDKNNTNLFPFINAAWIYIPPLSYTINDQIDDMIHHFFDHYDPLNPVLIKSPIFKEKLDEYLELIMNKASSQEGLDETSVINALDTYLNKIMGDETLFESSLQYIWDYMYKKALEDVTEYLDVNYLAGSCLAEDDEQLKERLLAYERLAVGSAAPEIVWTDKDGEKSLSQMKGGPVLVVFWGSWCPHCINTLSGVHEYFSKQPDVNILAIGLDEDAQAWNSAIVRYPLWTHIRASEEWDSQSAKDYAIYATPTFYILNEEGKILGKAKNLSEIEVYFPDGK